METVVSKGWQLPEFLNTTAFPFSVPKIPADPAGTYVNDGISRVTYFDLVTNPKTIVKFALLPILAITLIFSQVK